MLLRFNTFFKVTALLHTEADKKRVLHELAACAPAVPDGPCRVPQCSALQQCRLESERSGVNGGGTARSCACYSLTPRG